MVRLAMFAGIDGKEIVETSDCDMKGFRRSMVSWIRVQAKEELQLSFEIES